MMCQDCLLECWRMALEPENRAGLARQRGGVGVGPQMATRSYIDPGQAAEGDQGAVPKRTSGGEWRDLDGGRGVVADAGDGGVLAGVYEMIRR